MSKCVKCKKDMKGLQKSYCDMCLQDLRIILSQEHEDELGKTKVLRYVGYVVDPEKELYGLLITAEELYDLRTFVERAAYSEHISAEDKVRAVELHKKLIVASVESGNIRESLLKFEGIDKVFDRLTQNEEEVEDANK